MSPARKSASGKTLIWRVFALTQAAGDPYILGEIKWAARWRRYAYYPSAEISTVYEQDCLRSIADFVEKRTLLHREKLQARNMA